VAHRVNCLVSGSSSEFLVGGDVVDLALLLDLLANPLFVGNSLPEESYTIIRRAGLSMSAPQEMAEEADSISDLLG
jgi:hypothetical protein